MPLYSMDPSRFGSAQPRQKTQKNGKKICGKKMTAGQAPSLLIFLP
jgi:hypothetical protein